MHLQLSLSQSDIFTEQAVLRKSIRICVIPANCNDFHNTAPVSQITADSPEAFKTAEINFTGLVCSQLTQLHVRMTGLVSSKQTISS